MYGNIYIYLVYNGKYTLAMLNLQDAVYNIYTCFLWASVPQFLILLLSPGKSETL